MDNNPSFSLSLFLLISREGSGNEKASAGIKQKVRTSSRGGESSTALSQPERQRRILFGDQWGEERMGGENVDHKGDNSYFDIVTTSRYVVPTGRVNIPAGRYVVPTGKDKIILLLLTYSGVDSKVSSDKEMHRYDRDMHEIS
ncbi:hypothetical protein Tco_1032572 [Tanacetum coccineum]|uniref:Uncharacterized protein n=1 Tax=Tanacetum coccineum TaxID=301880 RepID=A0ABQ5GDL9_9ASTR